MISNKIHLDDCEHKGCKEPNEPGGSTGYGDKAICVKGPEEDHARNHKKCIALVGNDANKNGICGFVIFRRKIGYKGSMVEYVFPSFDDPGRNLDQNLHIVLFTLLDLFGDEAFCYRFSLPDSCESGITDRRRVEELTAVKLFCTSTIFF